VAENTGSRPPVAIRIVRPYQTDDEFLENELETVGKTSVILIGAHARPTGVILRFEVTLADGATALRGEGRVLAHKENAFRGQPGLSLRFTRLDPKSKALVDRATAIREAKAAGDPAPMSVRPPAPSSPGSEPMVGPVSSSRPSPSVRPGASSRPDASIADALTAETPPPPSRTSRPPPGRRSAPPRSASIPPQPPAVVKRSEPARAPSVAPMPSSPPIPPAPAVPAIAAAAAGTRTLERPADRDDLLARLRERRAVLSQERVAEILAPRS
jgi:hypothetical protein